MISTQPRTKGSPIRRLRALGQAEWLQFTRNRLLVVMALLFPVLLPVVMWMAGDRSVSSIAIASDIFVLFALGFGVFYPALSMAVTRRDEGVLKRLRTGEARDWEVLSAILLPLAVAMLLLTVAIVVGLSAGSNTWPVNPVLMLAAVLLGIATSHGFALLTSQFTPNAENAQITSMPVLMLLIFSQAGLRDIMPDRVAQVFDRNPFALTIDLFRTGWIDEGTFGSTFTDSWPSLLTLTAWAVALVWGGYQYMRWDTHR
ncbi:ABC transporter permease [uncultured Corynebacterium sp.]|uniref:ABC transporter permease n=1 Tax=uncultured Corynebacterium sp. TaxID=159447 RepID=UPI002596755E|nr:ABC transporter permease [uncultured Corynebacterium sp.]